MRRALENPLALLLRHAAEDGKPLPFLLQLFEVGQAMKDLLLGLIADRAGVVEDEVGIFLALHLLVAFRDERAHDLFRVVKVHLAAKGLDVKSFLLSAHTIPKNISIARVGRATLPLGRVSSRLRLNFRSSALACRPAARGHSRRHDP